MPGTIQLNIPLSSFLRKYLVQKYGDYHCVSKSSWLGIYLLDLLDKQYRKVKANINKESYYTVSVPSTVIKEIGFDISAQKLKHLSDMIYKVFLNDLYSYIAVTISSELKYFNETHESINKQNVYQAIYQFLKHYEIGEDELSADTLYKSYQRFMKSDKENIFIQSKQA
jgi:hypothetical protein